MLNTTSTVTTIFIDKTSIACISSESQYWKQKRNKQLLLAVNLTQMKNIGILKGHFSVQVYLATSHPLHNRN